MAALASWEPFGQSSGGSVPARHPRQHAVQINQHVRWRPKAVASDTFVPGDVPFPPIAPDSTAARHHQMYQGMLIAPDTTRGDACACIEGATGIETVSAIEGYSARSV